MILLLVEDNAAMRRLIRSLLCDLAATIHECDDGACALAAYQQHQPDWVLMDIKMPGLDGIAASLQITQADPTAKIIVVSDYDDERLRKAAQSAGVRTYLPKERLLELRSILAATATC